MIIKYSDNLELEKQANARIRVLREKLSEAKLENDEVAEDTLNNAINHLKAIKKFAKEGREIFLDDDDLFVLGL